MKIAISATGTNLDADIDPRFGRCPQFLIVDSETMNVTVQDNQGIAMGGGAGIQAAQSVAGCGINAVITGNCGPNAVRTLQAAGIQIYLGQSGRVGDALERFMDGDLSAADSPNVTEHHGMGAGAPTSDAPAQPREQGVAVQAAPADGRRSMSAAPSENQGGGAGRGAGQGMGGGRGMGQGRGAGQGGGAGKGRGMGGGMGGGGGRGGKGMGRRGR